MSNIFENAYFDKAYKTRDGRKLIYLRRLDKDCCLLSDGNKEIVYPNCGSFNSSYDEDKKTDIISELEETINEKELEELANDEAQLYSVVKTTEWKEGFKAGYRKAKNMK